MAKKKQQSLAERIESLSNAIQGKDSTDLGAVKSGLTQLGILVKALEEGAVVGDAEAKVEILETALEQSNARNEQSNAQITNLQSELNAAKAEIKRFRAAEREKQEEERKKDLPDAQVELLRILEPERLGLMKVSEILDSISLREDEAVWHLNKLKELKLADFTHHAIGYEMWYRTELGNAEVIARRMAARGDLPDIAEKILAELSPPGRAPGRVGVDMTAAGITLLLNIPEDLALKYLERLRAAEYAIRAYKRTGTFWSRHPDGSEYLKAKGLAGEEEQPNANKGLGENATKVLILIAREDGLDETAIAERMKIRLSVIRRILRTLREDGYATDAEKPGEAFATSDGPSGPIWKLLIKGEDFLNDRSLL